VLDARPLAKALYTHWNFSPIMKRISFLLLSLVITSVSVASETLQKQDFIGDWLQELNQYNRSEIILEIKTDFSGHVTRKYKPNSLQECSFKGEDTIVVDDILIVNCHRTESGRFKFVLGGWKTSGSSKLFGKMYMYDETHMYNGVSVSFDGN
jgi:hypothetical protein